MPLTQADLRRRIRVWLITRSVTDRLGNLHDQLGRFARKFGAAAAREAIRRHLRGDATMADTAKGVAAVTRIAEYPDGHRHVVKAYPGQPHKAKVEHVVSMVGEAVGARVPAVVPTGDDSIAMEFVTGRPAPDHFPPDAIRLSPAGLRMGILDVLVGNGDRHRYNWVIADDGQPIGYDHGEAFKTVATLPQFDWAGFAYTFVTLDPFHNTAFRSSNPLHPDDLEALRPRLLRLESLFHSYGMDADFHAMLQRLDELKKRAKGTERLLS